MKHHIVLTPSKIRKHNNFLRNWAMRTKSDALAEMILSGIISSKGGRALVRGTSHK